MISNMRIGRKLGSAVAFGGLAMLLVVTSSEAQQGSQTQTAATGIKLTATSANVAHPGDTIKITVSRWSSDEERNAIIGAMNPPPRGGRG